MAVVLFKRIYKNNTFKIVIIISVSTCVFGLFLRMETYFVSQAELDSLLQLKAQMPGKVIVLNSDCIRCDYHSNFRPAAFANRRAYVEKISGKPVIYNRSIFRAPDRPTGKKELEKLKAGYIYVVKYEDYVEKLPFSPGDYNLDLIYENANSQLWKIKSFDIAQ